MACAQSRDAAARARAPAVGYFGASGSREMMLTRERTNEAWVLIRWYIINIHTGHGVTTTRRKGGKWEGRATDPRSPAPGSTRELRVRGRGSSRMMRRCGEPLETPQLVGERVHEARPGLVGILPVACCEGPRLMSIARSEGHATPPASSHPMAARPLGSPFWSAVELPGPGPSPPSDAAG